MSKKHLSSWLLLMLAICGTASTDGPSSHHRLIEGTPVTGFNRLFGNPVWNFGPLGTPGYSTVQAFNPGGSQPLPLTAASAPSTLLATYIDPFWFRVTGIDPATVADRFNIPLRDVPVIVDPFGKTEALPPLEEGTELDFTQAASNGPITLGNWLQARGVLDIRCDRKGSSVRLQFRRLIPNGLYSVWVGFQTNFGGSPFLGIGPLGGVPNAFTADDDGRATFERQLNFCPIDLGPNDAPVVVVDVVFHSNQQLYGARPSLPRVSVFSGAVSHSQLNFLISGKPAQ